MQMQRLLLGAMIGGVAGAGVSYYLSQTTYKLMCQTCFCPQGDYACYTGTNCSTPGTMPLCPDPKICPNDATELQCINPMFGINPVLIIPPVVGLLLGGIIGLLSQKF